MLVREKDCLTTHSFLFSISQRNHNEIKDKLLGRVLSKAIFDLKTNHLVAQKNTQLTPDLLDQIINNQITNVYLRSPLTCNLYRAVCQKCYGWDLANENLVDIGEAIGILAGQSIGEPGTQLTMRTFHTGGIFTAEARQQIISPLTGIIQFYKILETVVLRTNRGEEVLVTKTSGSLVLIPDDKKKQVVQIEVLRNTILFSKNNQYILKDTVIGELINVNKQTKIEIKPILSDTSGEIYIPRLKQKINVLNNNKLIWILLGQLYNSPRDSFLNFYPDYKINKDSYIFRTKIISHYNGFVKFIKTKTSLYQQLVRISNKKYSLKNARLKKLLTDFDCNNYLLTIENLNYFVKITRRNSKRYLQLTRNEKFGTLILNSFQTLVGGTLYYNSRNLFKKNKQNKTISYFYRTNKSQKGLSIIRHRTIVWLEEEFHKVNCEPNILLVDDGDFISKGFELIPGLFSKTSGLVRIIQKNNLIKTIRIKSGLVYEGKNFKSASKKLYYPGEILLSNITIKTLSFCEYLHGKNHDQLLIRPITIYEFPYSTVPSISSSSKLTHNSIFSLTSKSLYRYKSSQSIKSFKNLNLISNVLNFKTYKSLAKNINIELVKNSKHNVIYFDIIEKLDLVNYLPANLRYTNTQSCFLIQQNQFLSEYTTLGYLESLTRNSLEIVKFKIKKQAIKQIFLISNNDCLTIKKSEASHKKLNDFITSKINLAKMGKIIIDNKNFFTIQKGRPYFFPNCKNDNFGSKSNLQYKLISPSRILSNFFTSRLISLNYSNIAKFSVKKKINNRENFVQKDSLTSEFSKLFIKKTGKLYSSLIPQFFKNFSISSPNSKLKVNNILRSNTSKNLESRTIDRTLLIRSSDLIENSIKLKNSENIDYQLTSLKFVYQQFNRSTKLIGLYSITEDYFEQDVNNVFCIDKEFIEAGKTIGLLNLEKEITGDIVQGLPRIEEILEARKKNIVIKRIPTSQKKGLLIQKTSLDTNFEFKKAGNPIQENDKINPHKLLKVYFNYYGLMKYFLCDRTKTVKGTRLIDNYEGSYKSFKKVQLFILNAVQSVYQSQGVTINDKHLEVIIKQMTTKVLITYEGDTPLLRREVIDLYHIRYINDIIANEQKQSAYYIPLLLGITKASLNNPSFISAASFQETTRVLTKAAIEGRIDWLRGLKENIIIGHLIPAGTGSQNYQNCFIKQSSKVRVVDSSLKSFLNLMQKSRQSS